MMFCLFWKAFKTLNPERRFEAADVDNSQAGDSKL